MVKITFRQPQFIPVLTCPLKSISTLPRYPDSHIWGRLGPLRDQKQPWLPPTQLHFQLDSGWLNSCYGWLDLYLYPPSLFSPSHPPQGGLHHTPGAIYISIIAGNNPKFSQHIQNIILHGKYLVVALIYTCNHPSSWVYLTNPKGHLITHLGAPGLSSEPRSNPKYPQHSYIFYSVALDG